MASNTSNLNLYKKDPISDGNDTFNIKTMLNDNWDKVDNEFKKNYDKIDNINNTIKDINNKIICGEGSFNGIDGIKIDHNSNTLNYVVNITQSSPDTEGSVGLFWIEDKKETSFIVKNTGEKNQKFFWILVKF